MSNSRLRRRELTENNSKVAVFRQGWLHSRKSKHNQGMSKKTPQAKG